VSGCCCCCCGSVDPHDGGNIFPTQSWPPQKRAKKKGGGVHKIIKKPKKIESVRMTLGGSMVVNSSGSALPSMLFSTRTRPVCIMYIFLFSTPAIRTSTKYNTLQYITIQYNTLQTVLQYYDTIYNSIH